VVVALLLLSGACAGSPPASADPPEAPSAAALHGEWRRDYITAGAVQSHSWLRFHPDGSLVLDTSSTTSFTEPAAMARYLGSYAVTGDGTVQYEWSDGGAISRRVDTLALVESPTLDIFHPCCTETDRWWTFRGYLAAAGSLTRFLRETMRRGLDPAGAVLTSVRTRVTLELSAPLLDLVGRDGGTLDVAVEIETGIGDAADRREVRLTLPCRIAAVDPDLVAAVIPGWDVDPQTASPSAPDGQSVVKSPYVARNIWWTMVSELTETTDWPEASRAALLDAFEPYLAFDPRRPNVLFHNIDRNSNLGEGYGRAPAD
jgi:hypothetical protein